ncbi:MAG: hypothetical protein M1817_001516 [Caeruleum heppii]|nr:MAG: hypothetical protein M1817_001516 [Caeruleum heppii]
MSLSTLRRGSTPVESPLGSRDNSAVPSPQGWVSGGRLWFDGVFNETARALGNQAVESPSDYPEHGPIGTPRHATELSPQPLTTSATASATAAAPTPTAPAPTATAVLMTQSSGLGLGLTTNNDTGEASANAAPGEQHEFDHAPTYYAGQAAGDDGDDDDDPIPNQHRRSGRTSRFFPQGSRQSTSGTTSGGSGNGSSGRVQPATSGTQGHSVSGSTNGVAAYRSPRAIAGDGSTQQGNVHDNTRSIFALPTENGNVWGAAGLPAPASTTASKAGSPHINGIGNGVPPGLPPLTNGASTSSSSSNGLVNGHHSATTTDHAPGNGAAPPNAWPKVNGLVTGVQSGLHRPINGNSNSSSSSNGLINGHGSATIGGHTPGHVATPSNILPMMPSTSRGAGSTRTQAVLEVSLQGHTPPASTVQRPVAAPCPPYPSTSSVPPASSHHHGSTRSGILLSTADQQAYEYRKMAEREQAAARQMAARPPMHGYNGAPHLPPGYQGRPMGAMPNGNVNGVVHPNGRGQGGNGGNVMPPHGNGINGINGTNPRPSASGPQPTGRPPGM